MKKLNEVEQFKINELVSLSIHENKNMNIQKAISYLLKAWDILPDPKVVYADSFRISNYIIELYIKINNLEEAKKWSKTIYLCDIERAETGEREFLSGKIAYENLDFEMAKYFFWIANEKSEGRCFVNRDEKYYTFFKKEIKDKYPYPYFN